MSRRGLTLWGSFTAQTFLARWRSSLGSPMRTTIFREVGFVITPLLTWGSFSFSAITSAAGVGVVFVGCSIFFPRHDFAICPTALHTQQHGLLSSTTTNILLSRHVRIFEMSKNVCLVSRCYPRLAFNSTHVVDWTIFSEKNCNPVLRDVNWSAMYCYFFWSYLSIYLSKFGHIYLSIYLIWSYLSIYLSKFGHIYLSIYLSLVISIYLSIYLSLVISIYLSIYLSLVISIYLSIYLSLVISIYLSIYLSKFGHIYLSIYLSKFGHIYLSIYLSKFGHIYLSIYLSKFGHIYLSKFGHIYLSKFGHIYLSKFGHIYLSKFGHIYLSKFGHIYLSI
ncbi:unnamed protein product [Acanthosepion pharaonis]|uniref:Uncharacterized protein n=1 Tax=Acanthosepion pharaonis TaxID=158019 RepID=A0A812C9W0_ACAPH|nr:unnamed protein product [Sepia pharaonis]